MAGESEQDFDRKSEASSWRERESNLDKKEEYKMKDREIMEALLEGKILVNEYSKATATCVGNELNISNGDYRNLFTGQGWSIIPVKKSLTASDIRAAAAAGNDCPNSPLINKLIKNLGL